MNPNRFDSISRLLAERRMTRRQAVRQGGAGLAVGAIAVAGVSRLARAQDATPAADIPTATVDETTIEKTEFLFVQSFKNGTLVARTGDGPGGHTLTLEQGLGQTIFFSDRPERIVGAKATADFLQDLGFSAENPPNAALVMETTPGDSDFAVFELFNPRYDAETSTATYDVHLLEEWEQKVDMTFTEQQTEAQYLHPEFGAAHLFIDGCADEAVSCIKMSEPGRIAAQWSTAPFCYDAAEGCYPCVSAGTPITYKGIQDYWESQCNFVFAEDCDGDCYGAWTGGDCDDC